MSSPDETIKTPAGPEKLIEAKGNPEALRKSVDDLSKIIRARAISLLKAKEVEDGSSEKDAQKKAEAAAISLSSAKEVALQYRKAQVAHSTAEARYYEATQSGNREQIGVAELEMQNKLQRLEGMGYKVSSLIGENTDSKVEKIVGGSIDYLWKKPMRLAKNHPVLTTGALTAAGYSGSSLLTGTAGLSGSTILSALEGLTWNSSSSTLTGFSQGGIVFGSAVAGYGAGKLLGKIIDATTTKLFGTSFGTERLTKYLGGGAGGIASATIMGLSGLSFGAAAGVPLGLGLAYKGIRKWLNSGKKQFDVDEATKAIEKEKVSTTSMLERQKETREIMKEIEFLSAEYKKNGGTALEFVSNSDGDFVEIMSDASPAYVLGVTLMSSDPGTSTVADLKRAWDAVKSKTEKIVKEQEQVQTKNSPAEVKKAQSMEEEREKMRKAWKKLNGTSHMSADLERSFSKTKKMLAEFIKGEGSTLTISDVEKDFAKTRDEFDAMYKDKLKKEKDGKSIESIQKEAKELKDEGNGIWTGIDATLQANPVAQQTLQEAEAAHIELNNLFKSIERSKDPADAKSKLERLDNAFTKLQQKVQEAKANVAGAKNAATRIDTLLRDPELQNALDAVRELTQNVRRFKDAVEIQLRDAKEAQARNADKAEGDSIWFRNKSRIVETREKVTDGFAAWARSSTVAPGRIATDLKNEFVGVFADPNLTDNPGFNTGNMESLLKHFEKNLEAGAGESMNAINIGLTKLKATLGRNGDYLEPLLSRCARPGNLPSVRDIQEAIAPYRA